MKRKIRKVGWVAIFLLTALGVISALMRINITISVLRSDNYVPGPEAFAQDYIGMPLTILFHTVLGLIFFVIGPLQFIARIRNSYLPVHRWLGRLFVFSSLVIAASSLYLVFKQPLGGLNETVAILFFSLILVFSLAKAIYHIKRKEVAKHREWMIRVFSLGLGISTTRLVVTALLIISKGTFADVLGTAFWLGLGINLLIAEIWINTSRPAVKESQTMAAAITT